MADKSENTIYLNKYQSIRTQSSLRGGLQPDVAIQLIVMPRLDRGIQTLNVIPAEAGIHGDDLLFPCLSSLRRQGSTTLFVVDIDSCLRRNDNLSIVLDPAIKSRDDDFKSALPWGLFNASPVVGNG